METLSRLIEKREAVAPVASCAEVAAMFDADPTAAALAVIQDERPIGIVYRDVLQGMMRVAGEALAATPIAAVMDSAPRIVPADSDANAFVDSLRDSAQPVFRTAYVAIDDAGRYVGVGGLTSLLSVHQRRRNEARDARALIERMAMDIGDHLDGVLAIAARLEQQRLTPDAAAFVRAISDTSRDMSETVGRAIDLHRSAQGHLAFKPEPTRLRDLADALEARWAHRAQDGGSTLLVSYDGDPECGVELDGERLMQVFDILVENALAGGCGMIEVRLTARPEGDLVRLDGQVRDNTAGHDAEERLARLAGAMGQPSLQDRSEIALSVGLALARRDMRAMGAPLHAEANPGAGVTVGFSLIARAADTIAAHAGEPTLSARAAHILIVDDNATNRMVAEALCDMFDCTSEQAVDGVEAVDMARGGRFDLILMDIKMPRMDGVAATRAIRDMGGRVGQTPVVALTANADPLDVQTYIAAGMQDVVEKPIKPERLAVVLSALLGGEDETSETEAA